MLCRPKTEPSGRSQPFLDYAWDKNLCRHFSLPSSLVGGTRSILNVSMQCLQALKSSSSPRHVVALPKALPDEST